MSEKEKGCDDVKVFDFDNTLFKGESSYHFAIYMIRYNKKIIRFIPTILFSLVGYKLCLLSKARLESILNDFMEGVLDGTNSPVDYVKPFWEKYSHRLYQDNLKLIKPDDVIISASPRFLFDGIREQLNTDKIVGTEVDFEKKRVTWFNFGDNKVKRYKALYGDQKIDAFYTDSYNDKDMMAIADTVYIVKKGVPVKQSKRSE